MHQNSNKNITEFPQANRRMLHSSQHYSRKIAWVVKTLYCLKTAEQKLVWYYSKSPRAYKKIIQVQFISSQGCSVVFAWDWKTAGRNFQKIQSLFLKKNSSGLIQQVFEMVLRNLSKQRKALVRLFSPLSDWQSYGIYDARACMKK